MKNYNKLVAKIQESNPSIMELKFGCEVKILTDDSDYHGNCKPEWNSVKVIKVSPKKKIITVMWHYPNPEVDYEERIEAGELKILGRSITMLDIMLTFPEIGIQRGDEMEDSRWILLDGEPTGIKWELNKSLEDQSDEVKQFLINLIVKK